MDPTSTTGVQAKVVARAAPDGSAVPFSVMLESGAPSGEHVDVTHRLVAAVAHSLWEARGGDALANWLDAENVVTRLLVGRAEPAKSATAPAATTAVAPAPAAPKKAGVPAPEPKPTKTGIGKRPGARR
jgi:hypothetical protein